MPVTTARARDGPPRNGTSTAAALPESAAGTGTPPRASTSAAANLTTTAAALPESAAGTGTPPRAGTSAATFSPTAAAMPENSAASALPPLGPVFAYHANVNGLGPRLEELQAATRSADVVSLQDTRLRCPERDDELWRTWWPDHRAYSFSQDADGLGCALLVHTRIQHRLLLRRSASRHRLLVAELVLHDGGGLVVASLHVPPEASVGGSPLRRDFLEAVFGGDGPRRRILLGDLNARALELGCSSTNTNGVELLEFVEESGTVVLNNPAVPTFHHVSCSSSARALRSPSRIRRLGPSPPKTASRKSRRSGEPPTEVSGGTWREATTRPPPSCSTSSATRRRCRLCLLYTSPSPRDLSTSRMPSSA